MAGKNDLRMELKEALTNLWKRIGSKLSNLDERVTALEARVSALDGQSVSNSAQNSGTNE